MYFPDLYGTRWEKWTLISWIHGAQVSWCMLGSKNHVRSWLRNVMPMWPRYQSLRARLDGLKQRSETGKRGNLNSVESSWSELKWTRRFKGLLFLAVSGGDDQIYSYLEEKAHVTAFREWVCPNVGYNNIRGFIIIFSSTIATLKYTVPNFWSNPNLYWCPFFMYIVTNSDDDWAQPVMCHVAMSLPWGGWHQSYAGCREDGSHTGHIPPFPWFVTADLAYLSILRYLEQENHLKKSRENIKTSLPSSIQFCFQATRALIADSSHSHCLEADDDIMQALKHYTNCLQAVDSVDWEDMKRLIMFSATCGRIQLRSWCAVAAVVA